MLLNSKHIFSGGINADDNPRFLGVDEYLNCENFRIGVYGEGKNFVLENIPSTQLKFYYVPTGTNKVIGRAVDYKTLRVYWMNQNSNSDNDAIYAYDLFEDTTYTVLLSSQTEEGFNWSRSNRIDRNARVINGYFIYTDNNNEPQYIDVEAGIKLNQPSYVTDVLAYGTPIPYTTLTLIRRPPTYRLEVTKITDVGFVNNYIALNAYQFYYRYWYKNYQYSCLSTASQLIPLNSAADTYNAINVKLSFTEHIDDYVQQVDLIVGYGNFGKKFIVKSFNKDYYYDATAISDHNAGTTQLGATFYDNTTGIALDDITANTSFDDVALTAKTLELARNRLFLANVLKGYDTPTRTSLTATVGTINTDGAGSYPGVWKYMTIPFTYNGDTSHTIHYQTLYYIYAATVPQAYYYSTYRNGIGPLPGTLNATDATVSWDTENQLAYYIVRNNVDVPVGATYSYFPAVTFTNDGRTSDIIITSDIGNVQFFKSSSTYRISIAFFDRYRRKCGIVNNTVELTIDDRTAAQTVFDASINWTLNNTAASSEIPDWAYYYQIHISKNLTTRFFEQIYSSATKYVLRNQDGTYDYTPASFSEDNTFAIAFDLTPLFSYGLGYTFNEGDLCRIYAGTNYTVRVLLTDGNYVLCSPIDLGSTPTNKFIELYTPYKPSVTEPLYETGDIMPIINPTESGRIYGVTSGTINGDCYAIERSINTSPYFVEAMSPNDNVWQVWQTDRGWTNFVDTIGQQQKETAIDWSDTFINGTKTNGLNKFQPLNTKDIGNSSGSIQKLQLTNKMEEAGDVMLVIASEQVLSAYLSEVQLYKAAIVEGLITTDEVIGTINPLKFTCGTTHPESVCEYNGTVWGVDLVRGLVWQYDSNGIGAISYYKMHRFWDKYGKRFVEQGEDYIQTLCGFSYIDSCVDPSTKEVLFTLPQTEVNAVTSGIPVGYADALPSYTTLPSYASSIQNRFDVYDGQPKMMVYKYEKNRWTNAYQWLPDCQESIGNKLFSWKDGLLYLHNENTSSFNTIYGTQYPQRICLTSNAQNPTVIKDVADIGVEGEETPNYSVCYTDFPNEQITDLTSDDYNQNAEGVQYATWFRDRLSPNVSGTVIQKMYGGDLIKSGAPMIMCEFQIYSSKFIINFLDIGFNISKGHNQINSKPK